MTIPQASSGHERGGRRQHYRRTWRFRPATPRSLFDLTGRVAVVTGAGSGLGAAMAIGYAQVGVDVVLADVNMEGAEKTRATIAEQGGKAEVAQLDVTDRAACFALAEQVVRDRTARSTSWSTAPARPSAAPPRNFPKSSFNFILDLNLKGTYFCCQAFGGKMLAQGKGSIINIASIGSFTAYPWASAYLASKGGVLQVTQGAGARMARPRRARQRHRRRR